MEQPTMKNKQRNKYCLAAAGEHAVCSELARRGLNVSMTMGNAKAVDVLVSSFDNPGRFVTVEVKTTDKTKAVTGIFQKYATPDQKPHPDFWVVVRIEKDLTARFFVLTHREMGRVQMEQNGMPKWELHPKGCDSVSIKRLEPFSGRWEKIVSAVK